MPDTRTSAPLSSSPRSSFGPRALPFAALTLLRNSAIVPYLSACMPGGSTPVPEACRGRFRHGGVTAGPRRGDGRLSRMSQRYKRSVEEEEPMRGKVARSAAVTVALVGGAAAMPVAPASAIPAQTCQVAGGTLTGANFPPDQTFTLSPMGTTVSTTADGRLGPTAVPGSGSVAVGPVACTVVPPADTDVVPPCGVSSLPGCAPPGLG